MDLNTLWFILIAVLYIGFFVLEGFDMGVGILLPVLGKDDQTRRMMINTIGPHWDGNEVWLITAGGATFAAFPHWYATLFSGFYLPLFLILLALIVRGVAFEFRSKDDHPRWRSLWDWAIFFGSLIPAFLFGVAFTNFIRGVPIDETMTYVGGFWNLLNPFALLGGLVAVAGFTLHGAIFLSLKTDGALRKAAEDAAWKAWPAAVVTMVLYTVGMYFLTDILRQLGINPGPIPVGAGVALLAAGYLIYTRRSGWAFFLTSLAIVFAVTTIFMVLYPRVLVSSLDNAYSLTIYNASSGPYTLRVMSIVALIFVPIVLAYQAWSYWIFRKRVGGQSDLHY
ncbi:MAG TPA: cytochrome d ubiquinol oxidase subunit II [Anaerolinea thermolimosa]|uniref:Cytochrome d ubiquinol oxidase subunit II n=1 Tax=Anaerolinea thermolimosa TaxID=229919 RepID=A0A3D1JH25_9CHLR|nr:cytochrome d ubiquinol oxidase subunit II [Anaerolinea thermolimosa]GAP06952.1 cytochrome bd-I ubiquinol oxidase subunit 2 apoprotein [Anaerolinea thermolimosa]HCE17537.1 cytochrome d ubiquinol oxidase subunit II [Anaerolinea thermolimosa]